MPLRLSLAPWLLLMLSCVRSSEPPWDPLLETEHTVASARRLPSGEQVTTPEAVVGVEMLRDSRLKLELSQLPMEEPDPHSFSVKEAREVLAEFHDMLAQLKPR